MPDRDHTPSRDWVALTLAIGVATAFNLITIAVLINAFYRGNKSGDYTLSENATQVLIAGFGGFIGILGGYVGGRAVEKATTAAADAQSRAQQTGTPEQPISVRIDEQSDSSQLDETGLDRSLPRDPTPDG